MKIYILYKNYDIDDYRYMNNPQIEDYFISEEGAKERMEELKFFSPQFDYWIMEKEAKP